MTKIIVNIDSHEEGKLADRVNRLKPSGKPPLLTPEVQTVQFLRGVFSRSTMILPAFYMYHGASYGNDSNSVIDGYPGVILKKSLEFSSIGTIALACRCIFDNDPKKLSGASFSSKKDDVLLEVAKYWSKSSNRTEKEAFDALIFLRAIFKEFKKSENDLFKSPFPLCQRMALLIQYANQSVAHLTLENYEFSKLDVIHAVAAITLIGEIIRSFDESDENSNYFDELDIAALTVARKLFPEMPDVRLFEIIKIESQSKHYWQHSIEFGKHMLLEQLPYTIGWF